MTHSLTLPQPQRRWTFAACVLAQIAVAQRVCFGEAYGTITRRWPTPPHPGLPRSHPSLRTAGCRALVPSFVGTVANKLNCDCHPSAAREWGGRGCRVVEARSLRPGKETFFLSVIKPRSSPGLAPAHATLPQPAAYPALPPPTCRLMPSQPHLWPAPRRCRGCCQRERDRRRLRATRSVFVFWNPRTSWSLAWSYSKLQ